MATNGYYPLLLLYLLFGVCYMFMQVISAYSLVVCVCVCVGSYYLVELSPPIGTSFLPPHKLTRYHAQEFYSSNRQPTSKKELYNYRHSSLRMVIERSFGMVKAHFPILNLMPNFKWSRQCYVIVVCCTLHNFVRINNRDDELFNIWGEIEVEGSDTNSEGNGNTRASSSLAT